MKISRLYAKVSDKRRDFLQKLSTRLVRENQVICVEDLNVRGMVKNRRLSASISDVGWSEFVRMLEYKAAWYGRELVKVGRWFPSSKKCSDCGEVREKLSLKVRKWVCVCGACHDRDENAAKNVLAAGLAAIACGERSSGHLSSDDSVKLLSRKQEETFREEGILSL